MRGAVVLVAAAAAVVGVDLAYRATLDANRRESVARAAAQAERYNAERRALNRRRT